MSREHDPKLLGAAIDRADLTAIISSYYSDVIIKGSGAKRTCNAPWRGGSDPTSVTLSSAKGRWLYHDFVAGDGGDAYTFLTKIVGLEPAEAARTLLEDAGLGGEATAERREQLEAERLTREQKAAEAARAERKMKAQSIDRAKLRYEKAAEPPATHPYLVKKGLEPSELPGVRYDGGELLIPMLAPATGEFIGMQRIGPNLSAEKNKKYQYGTDRGRAACFTLGSLEEARRVAICEGVATGAAIRRAAIFDAVVVAFDTHGLLATGSAVRELLPDAEITFAADNDQFKPHAGNAGVTKALAAARAVGALIAVPDFSSVADLSSEPTDFDDLARLASPAEAARQLGARAPIDEDAVERAERHRRRATAVGRRAQLRDKDVDQVITLSERYLSNVWDSVREQLPEGPALVIVQSHIGTAKSTAVLNDRDIRGDDVKIETPLIELCSSIRRKADEVRRAIDPAAAETLDYRGLETDAYRYYHLGESRRIVITPNSDPKFSVSRDPDYTGDPEDAPIYSHKYVVYDESDAIVSRLSDSDITNEQSMFRAMLSTMAGALRKGGKVYALSAYHQQSELVVYKHVQKALAAEGIHVPIILVRNDHKPALGNTYEVLNVKAPKGSKGRQKALRAALTARVIERRRAGAMVAVACDSDVFANELYEAVREAFPDDPEPLLLDSTHKNEPRQRAFLDDPDRDARAHPVIIYSPVLQTGFDIPRDNHNHELFGYFSARSVTPLMGVQLLGRFRGARHMTLAIENYSSNQTTDIGEIKAELRDSLDADNKLLQTNIDGRRVWIDPVFTEVHAHNIAHERWLRSAWRSNLLALLDDQGWTQRDAAPVRLEPAVVDAYDIVRAAVHENEAAEIAEAERLTPSEADALRGRSDITKAQHRQLASFDYEQRYAAAPTTARILEDNRGRLTAIIARLANARADDETLLYERDRDLSSALFNGDGVARHRSADKLKRNAVARALSLAVLGFARIDPATLEPTGTYSADTEDAARLVNTLRTHRRAFGALVSIPDDETLQDSPLPFVSSYLRRLGFKTEQAARVDNRRPLADEYFDEIIRPLEDGARLEPTHPNRKRTKYRLVVGDDETQPDTRRVNHLITNGVLARGDDDVIRLEPAALRETFVRESEYDPGDRVRSYRAVPNLETYPNLRERLAEYEGVVQARVDKWRDERNSAAEDMAAPRPDRDFLYRHHRRADELATPDRDGDNQARDTSLATLFSGEKKCHEPAESTPETTPESGLEPLTPPSAEPVADPLTPAPVVELLLRYEYGEFTANVRERLADIFENDPPDAPERLARAARYLRLDGSGLAEYA